MLSALSLFGILSIKYIFLNNVNHKRNDHGVIHLKQTNKQTKTTNKQANKQTKSLPKQNEILR